MTGDLRALRSLGEIIDRERRGGRELASVRPGECHVALVPTNIAATVDSSVVVAVWDVDERMGAACHLEIPTGRANVLVLVDEIEAAGCDRRRLRAKLFGGCDARGSNLGARNVAVAEQMLEALDIPIIGRDTGGTCPRKITLHTDDFSVWVWRS